MLIDHILQTMKKNPILFVPHYIKRINSDYDLLKKFSFMVNNDAVRSYE